MRYLHPLAIALLVAATPLGVSGQDVEMLGRRYGTRPPASYFEEMERNPEAFQFTRGRAQRFEIARSLRGGAAGPSMALGPRNGPVVGDVFLPVLLGLFSDSPGTPPVTLGAVHASYFADAPGTVRAYYSEVSSDSITLLGETKDWTRSTLSQDSVTAGESGLADSRIGAFIKDLLALQDTVSWGLYDNDGPDGFPNSGDDDGYVDALAVMHPTSGAECGGTGNENRIWAHKWSLVGASGSAFTTSTPRVGGGGGFIRVDDYFVGGVMSCSGGSLNPIGIFTHETGHAFGLPDLYDTEEGNGKHAGAGIWDLMASGSWGCNNASPSQPCHMGAWSKAMLGWADVVTLAPDTDHGTLTLPPVETDGTVYRVDATDGSGEYFLIENRQRIGFDQNLFNEGLLIWQIDPDWVSARWGSNGVNAESHMGVWLRQADGLDDLGQSSGARGDAGDPFPGARMNTEFHTVSAPAAISYQGGVAGLTVFDIAPAVADDMQFRLTTRATTLTVSASGTGGPNGLFTVDGTQVDPPATTFDSWPFVPHTLEAIVGEPIAVGERRPFTGWADDPQAPRVRDVVTPVADTSFIANYSGAQYHLDITTTGGVNGIEPATFVSEPVSADLWFTPDTDVRVTAAPVTGFGFLTWTGPLAGQPDTASVTMSTPIAAGADFEVIYSVPDANLAIAATVDQDVQLVASDGTAPFSWQLVSGSLPLGLSLSGTGRLTGAAIELGMFTASVQAVDAIGLTGVGTMTFDVSAPVFPVEQLVSPFLLAGPALGQAQRDFLDRQGNGSGGYDLGDFRAWIQANPGLPLSANIEVLVAPRTQVVPVRMGESGSRR